MNRNIFGMRVVVMAVGLVVLGSIGLMGCGKRQLTEQTETVEPIDQIPSGETETVSQPILLDEEGFNVLAAFREDLPQGGEVLQEQQQTLTSSDGKQVLLSRSFVDNTFNLFVVGQLEPPSEGQVYRVWLRQPADEAAWIDAGALVAKAGNYGLSYSSANNLTPYSIAVVTLQPKETDQPSSEVVVQAEF